MTIPLPAGTQLILTGPVQAVELLTLAPAEVGDQEQISVLVMGSESPPQRGMISIPTPFGVMRTVAALDVDLGVVTLKMAKIPPAWQRRDAHRMPLVVPLRGTTVSLPALAGSAGPAQTRPVRFNGTTVDISPGGLSAVLTVESDALRLPSGVRDVFLELDPFSAHPVAATLRVVDVRSDQLRGEFEYLQPSDWLHLAAMARQAAELPPLD
ncbi:PilZ domain-containing protein [Cryptosporangium phraense]|uniref:PilZ domain-containing protein n=1 Tax=Cryptosporangium phraense TaxID=2593070 RepID=A0A545AZT1_9ACTN|nr:PilZ domain-containing protein [Cryptosporangium phraense]TQS46846.1 PilZ domain-containing protein [Cryptosporangium phraense]